MVMKFTYRKTLSIAPYGIEEFTVEDDICPTELTERIRIIRSFVKEGLKPEPSGTSLSITDEA